MFALEWGASNAPAASRSIHDLSIPPTLEGMLNTAMLIQTCPLHRDNAGKRRSILSRADILQFDSFLRHQGEVQHSCGPRTVLNLTTGAFGAPYRLLTGSSLNLPGTTVFLIKKGNRCSLLLALHFACGSWVEESKWLSQVHNLW